MNVSRHLDESEIGVSICYKRGSIYRRGRLDLDTRTHARTHSPCLFSKGNQATRLLSRPLVIGLSGNSLLCPSRSHFYKVALCFILFYGSGLTLDPNKSKATFVWVKRGVEGVERVPGKASNTFPGRMTTRTVRDMQSVDCQIQINRLCNQSK